MLKPVLRGFQAGVLIALGGSVFLACDSRYAGAALFSVALFGICMKGYSLFTGQVGYLALDHGKSAWQSLLLGLLGNAAASCGLGALVRAGLPALGETARALCLGKLDQSVFSTGVRAFFCGILMYLAVSIFREKGSALGILLCVPAFILSGFEHSIADMFYFGASGIVSLRALGFIWTAIAGNALGGLFLPVLTLLAEKGETHEG